MTMLTVDQALALCSVLGNTKTLPASQLPPHEAIPVVVCTDKRGVVFGYTTDVNADPMELTDARMCLRWSKEIGGVFGLAEKGPYNASASGNTTISATVTSLTLRGITAVFKCDIAAEKAWNAAPVAGR